MANAKTRWIVRTISVMVVAVLMASMLITGLTGLAAPPGISDQRKRITINDNKEFVVNNGQDRIWINGTNTPWNNWNDFGGDYDEEWWDTHFASLHENGINASRVWINCNGDGFINIAADGTVSGASPRHWTDLDSYFALARKHEIYIMATLLSFDHFKNRKAANFRNMISSSEKIDTFIQNYTLPFLARYGDNPYLWSIDLCNEPDWIFEDEECGNMPWESTSNFFARNAAAIHENSDVLVTVGMGFPKYNVDGSGYEGNKVSDAFLQNLYDNPNAYLDFWSTHYYDWVGQYYGNPFNMSPKAWKLDDSKPALIGECPAIGSPRSVGLYSNYQNAFANGWQGVMPWTSNGVDGMGRFRDLIKGTVYMFENHRELISPLDYIEVVDLNKSSLSLAVGASEALTVTVITNHTDQSVIWSSSDEEVATVDENGNVTALKPGETAITVKLVADESKFATCSIAVVTEVSDVSSAASDVSDIPPVVYKISDVVKALRYMVESLTLTQEEIAYLDVNFDGKLTIADAVTILQIIAGMREVPVQPLA